MSDNEIEVVDFTKIDIEGFEPVALRGGTRTMREGRLPVLYSEVSAHNLRRQGLTAKSYLAFLEDRGYALFYCKEADLMANQSDVHWINVSGAGIPVASLSLSDIHDGIHTDVLAVHAKAPWTVDGECPQIAPPI